MQVRIENVETVETHLRMGHSSIASMPVGQVIVMVQASTHLRGRQLRRVMVVAAGCSSTSVVRAVARR